MSSGHRHCASVPWRRTATAQHIICRGGTAAAQTQQQFWVRVAEDKGGDGSEAACKDAGACSGTLTGRAGRVLVSQLSPSS